MALGCLGSPATAAASSASWALRDQGAHWQEEPGRWWELPEVGGEPANKGQESACLQGGLECALRSGLPGAQLSMSPELPLPLMGPPAHTTAQSKWTAVEGSALGCKSPRFGLSFFSGALPGSFEKLLPDQVAAMCWEAELDSWALAGSGPGSDLWDHRLKAVPMGLMST